MKPSSPKLRLVPDTGSAKAEPAPSIRDALVTGDDLDEDLIPSTRPRRSRRSHEIGKKGRFAQVSLDWAAKVAKAADAPDYMVFTLLVYLAWKAEGSAFILSNDHLKQFGINRWTKYRALTRLEKAGIIRVRRDPGKATVVALL
jgi:hypothetical protein